MTAQVGPPRRRDWFQLGHLFHFLSISDPGMNLQKQGNSLMAPINIHYIHTSCYIQKSIWLNLFLVFTDTSLDELFDPAQLAVSSLLRPTGNRCYITLTTHRRSYLLSPNNKSGGRVYVSLHPTLCLPLHLGSKVPYVGSAIDFCIYYKGEIQPLIGIYSIWNLSINLIISSEIPSFPLDCWRNFIDPKVLRVKRRSESSDAFGINPEECQRNCLLSSISHGLSSPRRFVSFLVCPFSDARYIKKGSTRAYLQQEIAVNNTLTFVRP